MRSLVVLALLAATARADTSRECRILDLEFLPADHPTNHTPPQIVAWLEDTAGNFVDTVYITQATGTFGIGNRPGRFDFNSGPLWPYGRRITTFPVWSTKQPLRWPLVVFQDDNDDNLSHSLSISSHDFHFCRPTLPAEMDAITCPTADPDTDKGLLSGIDGSKYPPRNDLMTRDPDVDHFSTDTFALLNPFDAISQPTPAIGVQAAPSIALSPEIPPGNYVLWLEVSKEFDMNSTYNEETFPPPNVTFSEYGLPYRGQPSVLYRVPFELSTATTTATTLDYVGYGDPDGLDGNIRAPDDTITTDFPGSGAGRLGVISIGSAMHRVRLTSYREMDTTPPDQPRKIEIAAKSSRVTLTFPAPGDDFLDGNVASYEVRYLVGDTITEANFADAPVATLTATIAPAKSPQTLEITGLLPATTYSVGIRAFDNCKNPSALTVIELTTADRTGGEVDACFIATAAYGSVMANDVDKLRSFRDRTLAKSGFGELAVEAYYTFGPALANLIGESEVLRATARGALAPVVSRVTRSR